MLVPKRKQRIFAPITSDSISVFAWLRLGFVSRSFHDLTGPQPIPYYNRCQRNSFMFPSHQLSAENIMFWRRLTCLTLCLWTQLVLLHCAIGHGHLPTHVTEHPLIQQADGGTNSPEVHCNESGCICKGALVSKPVTPSDQQLETLDLPLVLANQIIRCEDVRAQFGHSLAPEIPPLRSGQMLRTWFGSFLI